MKPGHETRTHAEFSDGTIRSLNKDCECVTHDGPHWLHVDRLSKELCGSRDVHGQIIRLKDKLREMEKQGIVRLLTAQEATEIAK